MTTITAEVRTAREGVVAEHIRAEMAGDIDATLATFAGEPEYDIVPIGALRAGDAEVRNLLENLLHAFPDLGLHPVVTRHADDAVVIEGRMTGTHQGAYAGFPPTGRAMDLRAAIFFTFDGIDLVRETVYYDELTLLIQIGAVTPSAPAP
jgi:carboxymethylenebutenolidase